MKEQFLLGIGPQIQISTLECCKQSYFDGPWYEIEITNEYEEDGEICYQNYLYGYCLNEGLTGVMTQAEIKGTNEKAKDNFIKNIIEVIQLFQEDNDNKISFVRDDIQNKSVGEE